MAYDRGKTKETAMLQNMKKFGCNQIIFVLSCTTN